MPYGAPSQWADACVGRSAVNHLMGWAWWQKSLANKTGDHVNLRRISNWWKKSSGGAEKLWVEKFRSLEEGTRCTKLTDLLVQRLRQQQQLLNCVAVVRVNSQIDMHQSSRGQQKRYCCPTDVVGQSGPKMSGQIFYPSLPLNITLPTNYRLCFTLNK